MNPLLKAAIIIAVLVVTYYTHPLMFVGVAIYAAFVLTKAYSLRFPYGAAFVFAFLSGLFGGRRW